MVKNFRIGDKITITSQPTKWSSGCHYEYPMWKVKYPYNCEIKNIKYNNKTKHYSMTCGSYGWCLTTLIDENIIINNRILNRIKKLKQLQQR